VESDHRHVPAFSENKLKVIRCVIKSPDQRTSRWETPSPLFARVMTIEMPISSTIYSLLPTGRPARRVERRMAGVENANSRECTRKLLGGFRCHARIMRAYGNLLIQSFPGICSWHMIVNTLAHVCESFSLDHSGRRFSSRFMSGPAISTQFRVAQIFENGPLTLMRPVSRLLPAGCY
jgi:hypothetical protein